MGVSIVSVRGLSVSLAHARAVRAVESKTEGGNLHEVVLMGLLSRVTL